MGALLTLLVIATVSIIVVRVGATALMMTGLSWDTSSFQAYSAFFGVGFTTREAELVVEHPVRRRIIRDLILAGNVGLTSALATLVVTFVHSSETGDTVRAAGWILGGLALFVAFVNLPIVKRLLDWAIRKSLERAGVRHALDYELLLRVHSGYSVSEVEVLESCALAGRRLRESRPADDGIIVLGISKASGEFRGAPGPEDVIEIGDVITVYGEDEAIKHLA
ncbi:MAG: TrkA C-terminal domain-containing protein [Verrucomicrobiae bacterium]|nr:TrkA C-terminal domain-containing protein [Verrucomicrobiae bacterium]MCP5541371.1 TrkA C-terminal domain-containing protein [Akkermansiaceae bacterium]